MDLKILSEQLKDLDSKIIVALIAAIVSIIIAALNYLVQRRSIKIQRNSVSLQARQIENIEIENKEKKIKKELDEFYIPFDIYLSESSEYYKFFREGLPTEFRTLIYLVDKDTKFKKADGTYEKVYIKEDRMKIFEEILKNLDNLHRLIIEKSSIIEDTELIRSYSPDSNITDISFIADEERPSSIPNDIGMLAFFLTHIKFLKLAYNNQIDKSRLDNVRRYVYPRELNKKIKGNIRELQAKLGQRYR
jgi:hypothetical protein